MSRDETAKGSVVSDEVKILGSASKRPKSIEEISTETRISLDKCSEKIIDLMDLGLLIIEHDSDLYGHELVRYRLPSTQILTYEQ